MSDEAITKLHREKYSSSREKSFPMNNKIWELLDFFQEVYFDIVTQRKRIVKSKELLFRLTICINRGRKRIKFLSSTHEH